MYRASVNACRREAPVFSQQRRQVSVLARVGCSQRRVVGGRRGHRVDGDSSQCECGHVWESASFALLESPRVAARTDASTSNHGAASCHFALLCPPAGLLHAHVSHAGSSSAFWQPTGAIATASAARTVAPSFQKGANRHPCARTGPNCYQQCGATATTLARPSHDARERCGLATQRRASLSVLPYRASCSRSGLQVVAGHGRRHHIARSPVQSLPPHRHWPTAAASLQRCPTSPIRARSLAVNAVTRLIPASFSSCIDTLRAPVH
ncbi:hypothetical protein BKA63DRAFT_492133 [Paraphoma chrysanthemicola]|nr:hypothetical protein BKA63DRAFT_492133 [Paraphoma chrysanthemicola]